MPTIGDKKEENKRLTILGYGAAMSGKTRFINSLRKVYTGKCLIINYDMEDNLITLMSDPAASDIEYDQYDIPAGYDNLVKKIVALRRECPYDLIVLENLNRLYRNTMDKVLQLASRSEADGARIQDWGNANKKVFDRIRDLLTINGPRCVYMTAHQSLEKDETIGRFVGQILIPSKDLPQQLPSMFNMFLRFYTTQAPGKPPAYWVQCAGDGTWDAGDKTGGLSPKEEPDFVKMATKIGKRFFEPRRSDATPAEPAATAEVTPKAALEV